LIKHTLKQKAEQMASYIDLDLDLDKKISLSSSSDSRCGRFEPEIDGFGGRPRWAL
jgi:hypothetical protein